MYTSFSSFIDISTLYKSVNIFSFLVFNWRGQQLSHLRARSVSYLVKARWSLRRTALTNPWKHCFCVSATDSSTCLMISLNSSSKLYFIVREVSKYWQLWISATRMASEGEIYDLNFKKMLIKKKLGRNLHYMNTKTCKFSFFYVKARTLKRSLK